MIILLSDAHALQGKIFEKQKMAIFFSCRRVSPRMCWGRVSGEGIEVSSVLCFIRKSPTEDMAAHAGVGNFHRSLWPANMVQPCWFI